MAVLIEEPGIYVTAAEAARMLGVAQTRVWQLTKEGKLPSISTGSSRLIPLTAVEERLRRLGKRERQGAEPEKGQSS